MRRLPTETLSPLAGRVTEVLARYDYEMRPAIDAIDAAVPGYGGLFEPGTTSSEIRAAVDEVLDAAPPAPVSGDESAVPQVVLYVDGSSRGNPGPAGAGAVLQTPDRQIARLGCPVGSHAGNNVAEYAALRLGLEALVTRCDPDAVEIRIDSMTVIEDIWGADSSAGLDTQHTDTIHRHLSTVATYRWTHLADSDPNPADTRATVAADLAALGPG